MRPISVQHETLRIDLADTNPIRVDFRGRSALQAPELVLVPLFDNLIAHAAQAKLPVDLHFEELEFFNSSTISTIIQCVLAMRDKGVRTTIRYDARQKWQKVFFEAVGMLRGATGTLNVQSV